MNVTYAATLRKELERIDAARVAKRRERVIESFENPTTAIIDGKPYLLFNANDYLGLRHHAAVKRAEHEAAQTFGAGPGGVRFICGTSRVHVELEKALATFHKREAAMTFSSAFATNLAVLHALMKGQSKDSLVSARTLVISDELNHRSIIDGIRVAGLPKEQRAIFPHCDVQALDALLTERAGSADRVLIVTDGVFSMRGDHQDLAELQRVAEKHQDAFPEGILTIVDDAHGVGAFGATGRGTEEHCGACADVLIATMGKGFGADGGYVVGDKVLIDYLRESAATYIYSNPISPGTAGAALAGVQVVEREPALLASLRENVTLFKELVTKAGLTMTAHSEHPIQPVLIGDPERTARCVAQLFDEGYLLTGISYPVVPKGQDMIRVQLAATHTEEQITGLVRALTAHLTPEPI